MKAPGPLVEGQGMALLNLNYVWVEGGPHKTPPSQTFFFLEEDIAVLLEELQYPAKGVQKVKFRYLKRHAPPVSYMLPHQHFAAARMSVLTPFDGTVCRAGLSYCATVLGRMWDSWADLIVR